MNIEYDPNLKVIKTFKFNGDKSPKKSIDIDEIKKNLIDDGGLKYSTNTIEYLNLNNLVEIDPSINFFSYPDKGEFSDLAFLIEIFGVIEPLLVIKNDNSDNYTVVSGRSRLIALKSLYEKSCDNKYLCVPCIVLDSKTDPLIIQGIIISANLNYRKISREHLIKSIFLLDEILTKTKKSRNNINVTETISTQTGMSISSVNNYRQLKNLSPNALDLVYKDHMNLGIAKLLSKAPKEKQDEIIKTLGTDINNTLKVKTLLEDTKENNTSKKFVFQTWEDKKEKVKNMVPLKTNIIITVAVAAVEKCINALVDFKNDIALENSKNSINKFFKVRVNEDDMNQYVEKGYVKQSTLNKLIASK